MGGAGTGHVDGDRFFDPAALHGSTEARITADLLGHGEDFQIVAIGLGLENAGIGLDRVEIEHVGIGRDLAGLVQGHGRFDKARIAAAKNVKKHG
jgi:hypothetical protein